MIHNNSINAYHQDAKPISQRAQRVAAFCEMKFPQEFTDRELAEEMGFSHRSEIQPRITELVAKEILRESGKTKCMITGKTVRKVQYNGTLTQGTLI